MYYNIWNRLILHIPTWCVVYKWNRQDITHAYLVKCMEYIVIIDAVWRNVVSWTCPHLRIFHLIKKQTSSLEVFGRISTRLPSPFCRIPYCQLLLKMTKFHNIIFYLKKILMMCTYFIESSNFSRNLNQKNHNQMHWWSSLLK